MRLHEYGKLPVPWTTAWSGENRFEVRYCPYAKRAALWQPEAPGVGKPDFAKPHSVRQRRAMVECRCDICGKPLKNASKLSLSQESARQVQGIGVALLVVEAMMHTDCARVALSFCPSLKRQALEGSLKIRQVFRWRTIISTLTADATEEFAGVRREGAGGHIKLQILKFEPVSLRWLEAPGSAAT